MGIDSLTKAIVDESTAGRKATDDFRLNMADAYDYNPDAEAEKRRLQNETGIPALLMDDEVKAQAKRQTFIEKVAGVENHSPTTASFLSSPENARIAHDDVDNLSLAEKTIRSAGNFLKNDIPNLATTYGARIGAGYQEALGGAERFFGETAQRQRDMYEGFSIYEDDPALVAKGKARYQEGKAIESAVDADKPMKTYLGKILSGAVQSIGFMVPGLAAGAVSGPAAPVVALGSMGAMTGGQAYGEARDKGVSSNDAATSAAIQGGTEVATEMLPFMALTKFFKPGKLTTKIANYYLAEIPGEHIATAVQNTTGKYFEEADPEKRKQAAIDYFFSLEHTQDQVDTFFTTIVQGAIMSGTAAGVNRVGRRDTKTGTDGAVGELVNAAARTNAASGMMASLGEIARGSKLRERLPEKFREFIAQAKAETGVDNVYIPADRWATFWQEQGRSPDEMAREVLGDVKSYQEARQAGGDVVIPIEDYTTHLAASEFHQELMQDARLHPGDMTARELEEWSAKAPEDFSSFLGGLDKEPASDTKVYDAVLGELLGVGRDRSTAEREALLWQSRYRSRAERLGKDPWEMYQENPLRVTRPMPGFMTKRDAIDTSLDPFFDRLRANDVPTEAQAYGESLGDFLRMKGVQDSNGELASIGIDEGLKPFQRKMTQENGLSLDKAREAAVEAGYLPEGSDLTAFLDAIGDDARGSRVYSEVNRSEENATLRADLEELRGYLDSRGLDLSTTDNAAVRQAMQGVRAQQSAGEAYQTFAEGKRGSITFRPGLRDIALLEKADLSTFLHESGHAWLEELRQDGQTEEAPDQVRQDWVTVAGWLGVAPDASTIPVESHETFARSVEGYILEGKSPSVELQSAFQRFKAWLLRIYRDAKGLNVELTDEVRRVMDRLLATDEEIKRAENAQRFHPLFTDAAAAGMTEKEFKAYRKTAEDAHIEAEKDLQQKLMKELSREQEKWWKEERQKVRGEVEEEAKGEPVYEAFQVLTTGTTFSGDTASEGFKISRADLVKMYGEPFVKKLPRAFQRVYTKEGGLHPDAVAEVFGFSSGDEMIRMMANAPSMKKFVDAETDIRMRQKYGDMLNDGTIADEALKSIHNDYQGQVLRAELRALKRKQREVAPFVKAAKDDALQREKRERDYERRWMEAEKKLAVEIERGAKEEELRKIREEVRTNREAARRARMEMEAGIPPLEAFKTYAMQTIGVKEIRDIRPIVYLQAEQKAGRMAFEAAAKGQYDKAGEEKQKQLLNQYLYREAVAAREDTDKIVDYAKRLQKPSTQSRIGKAGQDYLEQINSILERYEFKERSLETLGARESLLEWARRQEEMGLEPAIPEEMLIDAGKRNYKTLTIDELRAVRDALKNIEHLSREANRIRIDNEEIELDQAIDELSASVAANFDPKRIPIDKETKSWLEKRGDQINSLDASLIKIEQLVEWMDGGKIDGPFSRMIFQPIASAESREHDLSLTFTTKLADIFEAYGKKKQKEMMEKVFISSVNESITKQAAVAAALNTGNASNRTKLLEGYGWREDQLDEVLSHLDAGDWAFVQSVWDTIEELWPEISELEKRMSGVAPPKVEAREFTNAFGTWRGGYYPVVYDSAHSAAGEKQADAKGDRLFESTYVRATTEKGHTKARIEGAAYPILLSLEVIPQHMAQVIHDITHREAVVAANRLLNHKDMRGLLNETIGAPYYRQMKLWLATVANDRNVDRTGTEFWTRFLSGLRTNATIVGMGFRFTTMLNQIVGLSQSLDIVKGKYLGPAFLKFSRHPAESFEWVAEKSGEMRHRRNSLDRDIRDGIRKLMGKHGAKAWIQGKAFAGIGYMDAVVSIPTWIGAYDQAKAEGLSEKDAIASGDRAVRLSQGSGGAKDLASVQRSNDMMKMFTMFYSYFSVLYNRLRNMGHLKATGEIGFVDVAWKSFIMVMVPAIMGELLAARGPDDDEDKAWWAIRKVLAYPFLTIPIVRDMANAVESGRSYTMTPISRLFEMGAKLPAEVEKVAEGRKELDDLVFQFFDAPGYAFGLPTGQLRTTTKYIWDLTDGKIEAGDMGDVLKGLAFGHKKGGKR